jgi:hypothetical protein
MLIAALAAAACGPDRAAQKRISPEYDQSTGRLKLLKYDSNGNGVTDTWSYMDGARVVRIEIDKDEDGKIDRWEYYDANARIEKVGFSRQNDGKEDAWQFTGPDGAVSRVEISTRRDGKVTRTEHYQQGRLVAAEEDSDEDGNIDKWEAYDGARLASVAFDTAHRGTADRRLVYGADGRVTVEVDPDGTGHFVAADTKSAAQSRKNLTNPRNRQNPESGTSNPEPRP